MWKCNGSTWSLEGNLKGQKGDKGYSPSAYVTKDGDTATITIIDEKGSTTESVNDGKDGTNGNRWFRGVVVSGKATAPTQFTLDFAVNTDDNYINTSEGAVYHCTQGAAENKPTLWSYDFTLTGGGGGGVTDYVDLDGKPQIENHVLDGGNNTAASLGLATSEEVKKKYAKPSTGIPESDLAEDVSQKLANLDGDGEIDYSHVKNTPNLDNKINKPTTAIEGQVLTYKNNEWVADDAKGGAVDLSDVYGTSDLWTSKTSWAKDEICIDENKLWKCLISNSNKPTEGEEWTRISVGSLSAMPKVDTGYIPYPTLPSVSTGTLYTKHISFNQNFKTPPIVIPRYVDVAAEINSFYVKAENITKDGFDFKYRNNNKDSRTDLEWWAIGC